jgi:hypothetical protein
VPAAIRVRLTMPHAPATQRAPLGRPELLLNKMSCCGSAARDLRLIASLVCDIMIVLLAGPGATSSSE